MSEKSATSGISWFGIIAFLLIYATSTAVWYTVEENRRLNIRHEEILHQLIERQEEIGRVQARVLKQLDILKSKEK